MLIFGSDLLKIPKCDFLAFLPNFGHLDSENSCKNVLFAKKKENLSWKSRLEKYDREQKSICKLNEGISFNGGGKTNIPQVAWYLRGFWV